MPADNRIHKYGCNWPEYTEDLEIELDMIRRGGRWTSPKGTEVGLGLFEHFMIARKLAWPNRYRHRWTDLMYREFIQNDITILLGAASAQKTSGAVEFCLMNYWARPQNTLVILSTINMDKLDIGVWSELKMLWGDALKRHDWLSGKLIEYKRAITTDDIDEGRGRDFRRGIICRPCYVGGKWVGIGTLAGTKQDYIFYVADELQFMQEAFSASWPHLFANGQVKIIGAGNPKHDPEDQLAISAEPPGGWSAHPEPQKTEVWNTRAMGGRCINLVGTDSPNFDVAEGEKPPYARLINRDFAKRIAHDHGENSFEYYRLVKGVMRIAFAHSRVITRQLCRDHHALDTAQWLDTARTRVYGVDPSYGGEDRCVGMCLEWGNGVDGTQIIRVVAYRVFGFNLNIEKGPEEQLADMLYDELALYGIPSTNCFYDSTGKGTLGGPFAIKFGRFPPVGIDSGAQPTKRPVRHDLFVEELDNDGRPIKKRLKRCDEHYSKFVSEMWFSVRYAIEGNQFRELPEEVMTEGCARIYEMVAGNKLQVEPKSDPKKKEDLKRRLGKSPDLFDTLAISVEGARQRGFQIGRLGKETISYEKPDPWLEDASREYEDMIQGALLTYE